MLRPVRAFATPTLERAIDGIFASSLPEAVAQSLVEHRVVQRIAGEALARADVEAEVASVLESERFEQAVRDVLASPALERALHSPEFERVLGQLLASPQVRRALTQQSTSLAGEIADRARATTGRLDDRIERRPRRWFRRPALVTASPYAGIATRGVALVLDALLVTLAFMIGAACVKLVASLVGGHLRPVWLAAGLGGAAWLLLLVAYFVGFWSATGQTPGMRAMHLRVVDGRGAAPRAARSFVRLVGLVLAVIPCFAGFLPALVDDRRRALPDYLAGTVVLDTGAAFALPPSSEVDEAAATVPA
jgi:uncharacterized RDD family membrane protein YckC